MRSRICDTKGMTLVELLAVVVILGIIAAIAVPAVLNIIEKTRQDVCEASLLLIERSYERHLIIAGSEHHDMLFSQFLNEYEQPICEIECEVIYIDGKVKCSDQAEDGGEVPIL